MCVQKRACYRSGVDGGDPNESVPASPLVDTVSFHSSEPGSPVRPLSAAEKRKARRRNNNKRIFKKVSDRTVVLFFS